MRSRPVDHVALFVEDRRAARPRKPRPFGSEAALRRFAERRLEPVLGLTLVASEVPVDGWAAGRLDALAVDERLRPVVVEFKRAAPRGTVGQALGYLDWLISHRDTVALLVARRLGIKHADRLDWSAPRLVCVAEAFGAREEAIARQLPGRVELVRILRYGRNLFLVQRV